MSAIAELAQRIRWERNSFRNIAERNLILYNAILEVIKLEEKAKRKDAEEAVA